jgi:chromosome segregation ATPase
MYPGVAQVSFIVQLLLVSTFFLLAVLRVRSPGTPARPARPRVDRHPLRAARRAARRDRDASTDAGVRRSEEELALLAEERDRIARELELLRAEHAQEESHFRRRRREVLLEMHEYRRITTGLRAEEPHLQEHVQSLRAEVDHLEHRCVSLAAEVDASIAKSAALHERIGTSKRLLDSRHLDRERVERRIGIETAFLRDLARRRAVLRAETDELMALLDLLQQLSGQPATLTSLSDGGLRAAPTPRDEVVSQNGA